MGNHRHKQLLKEQVCKAEEFKKQILTGLPGNRH